MGKRNPTPYVLNNTIYFELCLICIIFASKFIKMSTKDKLIERFLQQPKDFSWDELLRLFYIFGFTIDNKGKTSGSRAVFVKDDEAHTVHKPYPSNIVKGYSMKQILDFLTRKGFLNEHKKEDF